MTSAGNSVCLWRWPSGRPAYERDDDDEGGGGGCDATFSLPLAWAAAAFLSRPCWRACERDCCFDGVAAGVGAAGVSRGAGADAECVGAGTGAATAGASGVTGRGGGATGSGATNSSGDGGRGCEGRQRVKTSRAPWKTAHRGLRRKRRRLELCLEFLDAHPVDRGLVQAFVHLAEQVLEGARHLEQPRFDELADARRDRDGLDEGDFGAQAGRHALEVWRKVVGVQRPDKDGRDGREREIQREEFCACE